MGFATAYPYSETPMTVAICTYNRAHLLGRLLELVDGQSYQPEELLVVDNGSQDGTQGVVNQFAARSKVPVRYVCEPNPGIANARNRALVEAGSDFLAFIDDDAWPAPNWLYELADTFRRHRPKPACVVGKVVLEWEGGRPSWMPGFVDPLLCSYDLGPSERFLTERDYLLTTNVAFHRPTILSLGGFRTYLGRKRGQMLGGEDNEIHQRLVRNGHSILYAPSAVVHHGVPIERQSRWFVIRRMFWDGATQPFMAFSEAQEKKQPYDATRGALGDLKAIGRLFLQRFGGKGGSSLFERLLAVVQRLGRLRSNCLLSVGRV